MNVEIFLQWLIGGPGSIMAVSWLLERMGWFQRLASETKKNVIFGMSAAVGCGALAVVLYVPQNVIDAVTPFFVVIAAIFATTYTANGFHKSTKISDKGPVLPAENDLP